MFQTRFDRRTLLSVGTVGAASAFGLRAVLAHEGEDHGGTPAAATPGATPGATPEVAEEVTVEMVDIDFNPNELTIPADADVLVRCPNTGQLPHDFHVEDTDYATELADPGETVSVVVNLPAGDYVYYCSVPGHREAGMEGTLTVE